MTCLCVAEAGTIDASILHGTAHSCYGSAIVEAVAAKTVTSTQCALCHQINALAVRTFD
jgi:hypothetical protein